MPIPAGTAFGAFEILAPLGAGAMGEVYRARDTKLGRDVAIKILPLAFAAEPQRRARFERESRILASLNHPNIAAIHSVERIDGLHLLILELVEGPTLADRLHDGSMAVADALLIARQLAEALASAHERGIVHRDLKPANVKLSASGRVVLLDFGLAKERAPAAEPSTEAAAYSSAGMILGTCAYMSPEQARGEVVDKRTDIWGFGCILFELLSGQKAFHGRTPADTIAAVLERQPDWAALPASLQPTIRVLLERCLEKDPYRRLHDIADARIEVDAALSEPIETRRGRNARSGWLARVAAVAVIAVGAAALGWWWRDSQRIDGARSATRFTWTLPDRMRLESPAAVSPDGRHVAFAASVDGAPPQLFIRSLDGFEARAIVRTEGAQHPFWAPDSRALAYFARGKLWRVAIEESVPIEICAAGNPRGGAWGSRGTIVFSPGSIYSGLSRVSADGGTAEPVTLLDTARGENSHRWPSFLPDGIHFVYFVRSIAAERRGVYLGRIDRPAATPAEPLFHSESEALYLPLDEVRGVLMTAAGLRVDLYPFDARRHMLSGAPRSLPLAVGGNTPHHASMLGGAEAVMAYVPSSIPFGDRLVSSSTRTGDQRQLDAERGIINWPRISPDGARLITQRLDAVTGSPDLWVDDLERGTRLRVTQENTSGQHPVWSPDGQRVAYVAGTFERPIVTIAAADGTGVVTTLACPRPRCEPSDWSRDGRWLVVTAIDGRSADVWMLPIAGGPARPLLDAPFVERDARISPDGQLVAYVSHEMGGPEISIRTLEGPPQRQVVSVGGGTQPVWQRDGTGLLFVDPKGTLQSAAIGRTAAGRLRIGSLKPVATAAIGSGHSSTQYDLSPDGQRVYFLDRQPAEPPREIGFILGWREFLK